MLRKCTFVMLAIFLRQYGPAPQVVAAAIVLVIALSAHLQHMPYHDKEHSRLESIGLHACLLVLLFTLLANLLGRDIDLEGRAYLGETSTILLTTFVFTVTVYFFCEVIFATIKASQHTRGAVGNIANLASKICGKRCTRPDTHQRKSIRLKKFVRKTMFEIHNLIPHPSHAIQLPPLPKKIQVSNVRSTKIHPGGFSTRIDGRLAKRAVKNKHMVEDVSKGIVKAIEAAEQAKGHLQKQKQQKHDKLLKRKEKHHLKRLKSESSGGASKKT